MSDPTILIVAIVVFVFLVIGLICTIYEFKTNIIVKDEKKRK
jgi:hypothetical protein